MCNQAEAEAWQEEHVELECALGNSRHWKRNYV